MTNFCRRGKLLLAAILAILPAAASAQTDEERAGARAAGLAGLDAFQSGKYEQAVDSFERAEHLLHAPTHLLYLARANAKLGHLVSAREYYLKLSQERIAPNASKPFRDAQTSADKELAELEPRVPYVSVVVQGNGAKDVQVTRDGARMPDPLLGVPHPEDPGSHTFAATADGMQSAPSTLLLKESARESVVLTLVPAAIPPALPKAAAARPSAGFGSDAAMDAQSQGSGGSSGLRIAGYVSIGLGAVGFGIGAYYLVKSHDVRSNANTLNDTCLKMMNCKESGAVDEIDAADADANKKRTIGAVGLIAGGALLATGLTLLIVDWSSSPKPEASSGSIRPLLGFNFAGVAGRF